MSEVSLVEVLGPRGLLAEAVPGWEPRPAQLEMAGAVAEALRDRRPLLVEAGTGTGKTLAYLVPALLSGLKVVVSTGTKNLQEQILQKDIPLLEKILRFPFTAVALKGIANYLCRRRTEEARTRELARGTFDVSLARIVEWARDSTTGDRAELDLPDDAPVWSDVMATSETRLGARCPYFEDCFVTQARRRAQQADLVVVNHHLFFADLVLKKNWPNAQLLPAYEAVIFDEAHGLEDVITDSFSTGASTLRIAGLVRDVRKAAALAEVEPRLVEIADHVESVGAHFFDAVRARLPREGKVALVADVFVGQPTNEFHALDNAALELESALGATSTPTPAAKETATSLAKRAHGLRDDLALIVDGTGVAHRARGMVYWGETRGRHVFLRASPVDVSDIVREHVVAPVEAAVFTSATLTTGGRFDFVRARLGLEAAGEARLESPFDYARQALLYLPTDLPEPSAREFTSAVADRMEQLVAASRGRAFLLFTSHRALETVARALAGRLEWPMLVQGERPKPKLVEDFKRRPSVLLATASFWEGVDVVGEALELVVIDKLPFAPPDDPLVAARTRRLEQDGIDPFGAYQVPEAALALAQGFGRLIRHRRDRGVVALCDRRASTKNYGRRVLASLPRECPRTDRLEDVKEFFARLRALRSTAKRD